MKPPRTPNRNGLRLIGGIPIPYAVLGLPTLAIVFVAAWTHTHKPAAQPPAAVPVRNADLVLQDRDDGSVAVLQAGSGQTVDVLPPGSNAFLRVTLMGLVRERRREGMDAPSQPFHITRWSDGRLTLRDDATGRLIELNAFGPDNTGAFARLLDLTPQQPRLLDPTSQQPRPLDPTPPQPGHPPG